MSALLIVEDQPDVARAYQRTFKRYQVDEVLLAASPAEAEAALARCVGPVCVLCDHWLGLGLPTGAELAGGWKARFPLVGKVALVTGSDVVAVAGAPAIDAVFEKPPDMEQIAAFFGFQRRT